MKLVKNPLISIITLNYNQTPVTCEFLESLKVLNYTNFEVIVVDNASKEDPTKTIKAKYPDVKVIRSAKNLGFTGGNNLGMREAKGDFLFIVNNDTEVTPDLIGKLIEPFYRDETIGMTSPKIYYYDHPKLIQYAGFTEINPVTGRNSAIGGMEIDHGQYDEGRYTAYAHGAAMMVPREVVEKVGMLPDMFFIYYEELDWSSQIRKANYHIYYQPEALILHKESVTMGRESAIKAYYHTRNRILFMRRNSKPSQFFLFTLFLIFFIIPKSLFKYISKMQLKHLNSFSRAIIWNIKNKKVNIITA